MTFSKHFLSFLVSLKHSVLVSVTYSIYTLRNLPSYGLVGPGFESRYRQEISSS